MSLKTEQSSKKKNFERKKVASVVGASKAGLSDAYKDILITEEDDGAASFPVAGAVSAMGEKRGSAPALEKV